MIGGATAFQAFKKLARALRELGYEVREQDEFAEFGMNGFVCSFRYFGVLDIDFLKPGQKLLSKGEPDMVLTWDGVGWRDVTDDGVLEVSRSNEELFNRCLKRLNYDVGASIGFFPNVCILVPPI
ncbi:MAG TPA: hypothetical protein V6D22_06400 [Candidatus Obscuribacterales bacterium]